MTVEILNKPTSENVSEILNFIFPTGNNKKTFEEGNLLRQYFYFNYNFPDLLYMREEYGLISRDCSFAVYILQVSGYDLDVVSCTRHTRTEMTGFETGYTFIRLPTGPDKFEKWEYINNGIQVKCQSIRIIGRINGKSKEMLQIKRDMCYQDNDMVDRTVEYYLEGTGIYKISFIQENNPIDMLPGY